MLTKPSEYKRLFSREFIFSADHDRAFKKLKTGQFVNYLQGITIELVANAIDANPSDAEPIEIDLNQVNGSYVLTYKDYGCGLEIQNLTALHFMGQSAKRADKSTSIGRFGLGLVSAFHPELGVARIEILSWLGGYRTGVPARINIACTPDRRPDWHVEPLTEELAPGFTISFHIPPKTAQAAARKLEQLLKDMTVPVKYQGRLYPAWKPENLRVSKNDTLVTINAENAPIQTSHTLGEYRDPAGIRVHLRRMPLGEIKPAWEFLNGFSKSGYDLPQNSSGAYVASSFENVVVISDVGEPVLGRDALFDDANARRIHEEIRLARMSAMSERFEHTRNSHRVMDDVWANLMTCRSLIIRKLKNEPLDNPIMEEFVDHLINFPAFSTLSGKSLSVRNILDTEAPAGWYAAAVSKESLLDMPGSYTGSIIIANGSAHFALFGFHLSRISEDLLKPILEGVGKNLFVIDHALNMSKQYLDLVLLGVLKEVKFSLFANATMDEQFTRFLEELKVFLNQPWFRAAVIADTPIRCIHLLGIKVEVDGGHNDDSGKHMIASVLQGNGYTDELWIGINCDAICVKRLVEIPNARGRCFAMLGVLIHEISHHPIQRIGGGKPQHHSAGVFQYQMMKLGDRIITNCIKHLLGKPVDEEAAHPDKSDGVLAV